MIGSQNNSYGIPLSLREWLVCIFATLTLVFTAWSLGGYKTWALHLLFASGMGTFLASVIPMPRSWNGYDQQHGNLKNFKRLLLQPFFWAGLCFLVYILIQYFNPSVVQVFGEKSWWVEPMSPPLGANLPSSVKADYQTMNALRTFVIQASAISLACGILVGIQRRKSALIILWSFVLSGVTMSFVAILQKLSGTEKLLWLVDVANKSSWGTFAYRNQGAAFLILVLLIAGLLYFFYERRAYSKLKQGGPHLLLFFFILLLCSSLWLALSRGGIIIGFALGICFLLLAFISYLRGLRNGQSWTISAIFLSIAIVAGILFFQLSDTKEIRKRITDSVETISDIGSYDRVLSTKATWKMAEDRLAFGWGAGSFRYVFPIYQKNYNALWYYYYRKDRGWIGRKIYDYAHNDWLQFLADYGIAGCVFLLVMFGALFRSSLSTFYYRMSVGLISLFALLLIIIHNFVDFIFSCPAYWIAFWGSLFLVNQLFNLERKCQDCT